jgi:hypothetical protein
METVWFDCECGTPEHSYRFVLDREDNELYLEVLLPNVSFISRLWRAFKYVLGHKSRYGQFTSIIVKEEDRIKLAGLLNGLRGVEDV